MISQTAVEIRLKKWFVPKHCICWKLCVAIAVVAAALSLVLSAANAQEIASLTFYRLSNDGKLLGFGVPGHIGLYDWRARTLEPIIDPPTQRTASLPVFSTDGQSFLLGFQGRHEFGMFDLPTRQLKTVFKSDCERLGSPIFQPGDQALLIEQGDAASKSLCLHDLRTGQSQIVLPSQIGFSLIRSVSFIAEDEILFVGRDPKDPVVTDQLRQLGVNPVTATIPYRFKFGGQPHIAFPDILERSRALMAPLSPDGPLEMYAADGGKKIVYVDRSLSEEARVQDSRRHPGRLGIAFHYDLFVIDNGVTRQVTQLEAFAGFPAVSLDGSTAAIGRFVGQMTKEKYLDRSKRGFEPLIVDVATGKVTETNLIDQINADPRFVPPPQK